MRQEQLNYEEENKLNELAKENFDEKLGTKKQLYEFFSIECNFIYFKNRIKTFF